MRLYLYLAGMLVAMGTPLTSVSAAEVEGQGAGLGIGGETCSIFMTTYEHNPESSHGDDETYAADEAVDNYTTSDYINWLQGYLSAYNIYQNDDVNVASRASIGGMLYFLYRRCSEDPDAAFHTVMPALLERIGTE